MVALLNFLGEVFLEEIVLIENYALELERARTVAFISLVWSENVRAYTSRSFNRPFWHDLCSNKSMQFAIGMAQVALYLAVFLPGFSDTILELQGAAIGGWGWGMAIA